MGFTGERIAFTCRISIRGYLVAYTNFAVTITLQLGTGMGHPEKFQMGLLVPPHDYFYLQSFLLRP